MSCNQIDERERESERVSQQERQKEEFNLIDWLNIELALWCPNGER